jgi:hypothetical protein
MAVIALDYQRDRAGNVIQVDYVHVADPYNGGSFRKLSAPEMLPRDQGGALTYLASVDVDDD